MTWLKTNTLIFRLPWTCWFFWLPEELVSVTQWDGQHMVPPHWVPFLRGDVHQRRGPRHTSFLPRRHNGHKNRLCRHFTGKISFLVSIWSKQANKFMWTFHDLHPYLTRLIKLNKLTSNQSIISKSGIFFNVFAKTQMRKKLNFCPPRKNSR